MDGATVIAALQGPRGIVPLHKLEVSFDSRSGLILRGLSSAIWRGVGKPRRFQNALKAWYNAPGSLQCCNYHRVIGLQYWVDSLEITALENIIK